jgi:hypothetical protein
MPSLPFTPAFLSRPVLPFFGLLVAGLLVAGCDSAGTDGSETDRSESWMGNWQVLTNTSPGVGGIDPVEIVYEEEGIGTYWILGAERIVVITTVQGVDGCGEDEFRVVDVAGNTVTIDNGVVIYTVEYEVSGEELFAVVVDAEEDEPGRLDGSGFVGTTWEAKAVAGDPYQRAGCL